MHEPAAHHERRGQHSAARGGGFVVNRVWFLSGLVLDGVGSCRGWLLSGLIVVRVGYCQRWFLSKSKRSWFDEKENVGGSTQAMKHKNDARSLVVMSYDKIEPMIWERF